MGAVAETAELKMVWQEEPGSGEPCFLCRSLCRGLQFRAAAQFQGEISPSCIVICQSCHAEEKWTKPG